MSVKLKPSTSEWVLDGAYEINRIALKRREGCHTHQFIEIVYTYCGRGRHVIDDREYTVGHGDLLLIDYGMHHTVEPIENLHYVDIMLKPEYVNEALKGTENAFRLLTLGEFSEFDGKAIRRTDLLHFAGEERKKIESLIEWTEEEQKKKLAGGELMRHSALNLLLSMVFRKMAESEQETFSINDELLMYIEKNCADRLRMDQLAQRCFYSPAHFSRRFKHFTGMSPKDYVNRCRIKRAEQLLRTTDMPVEQIVSECGFSNRTAFFKRFSQMLGCTPLQYRKNQK